MAGKILFNVETKGKTHGIKFKNKRRNFQTPLRLEQYI